MTDREPEELEDEPLDPRLESMRLKMVRLLAGSIGIMIAGVMAVLIVIVYKVTRDTPPEAPLSAGIGVPVDAPLVERIALPEGFRPQSVSLDGNRIAFYGTSAEGLRQLHLFDTGTGNPLGSIELGPAG